ncbi:Soma ferritin [Aspergillus fumigatus Z5]|nr:Soma ferritin [Aspergillus fumigatus Z5]
MSEQARAIISEISGHDLDQWLRPSTFTEELEESIRGHIHEELTSWMFYRKLAADCSRANIALHGFAMLWHRSAKECLIDMEWLEKYLIIRGGRCKPTNIEAPKYEWPDSPVEPVGPCREAFNVQRNLFVDLEKLCTLAEKCRDTAIVNAIESRFLRKHAKHLKNLGDLLQQVTRVSKQPGLGLYHLDAELRHNNGCIPWMSMNDPDTIEEGIRAVTKKIGGGLALQTHHEGTKLASKEVGHC